MPLGDGVSHSQVLAVVSADLACGTLFYSRYVMNEKDMAFAMTILALMGKQVVPGALEKQYQLAVQKIHVYQEQMAKQPKPAGPTSD